MASSSFKREKPSAPLGHGTALEVYGHSVCSQRKLALTQRGRRSPFGVFSGVAGPWSSVVDEAVPRIDGA